MTSCILLKAPDRLVVVADGRLSVSPTVVSFDTAPKIERFTPRYRIPVVMMGLFSHYRDWTGHDCFVSYAGTFALAALIKGEFRKLISERLVLVWRDRTPILSDTFHEDAQFADDYDFKASELPDLGPRDVVDSFRAAVQEKADEWCGNRGLPADCEFLLFGRDKDRKHYAYKVTIDPAWTLGKSVQVCVEPIRDGVLTAIGSPTVAAAAHEDEDLRSGMEGWSEDQTEIGLSNVLADPMGDSITSNRPPMPVTPTPEPDKNWSTNRVAERLGRHLRAAEDLSVGGDLTVAIGGWYGDISVGPLV